MTTLLQRMQEEMRLRNLAPSPQKIVRARTQTMGDLNREAAETLG